MLTTLIQNRLQPQSDIGITKTPISLPFLHFSAFKSRIINGVLTSSWAQLPIVPVHSNGADIFDTHKWKCIPYYSIFLFEVTIQHSHIGRTFYRSVSNTPNPYTLAIAPCPSPARQEALSSAQAPGNRRQTVAIPCRISIICYYKG